MSYRPGDIANNHVLSGDGTTWLLLPPPPGWKPSETKPSHRGRWIAAGMIGGILGLLITVGAVIDATTTDASEMSCVGLNDELDVIRARHIQGGFVQPFAAWGQDDLDRFRALIQEVTDRQNEDGDICALRPN